MYIYFSISISIKKVCIVCTLYFFFFFFSFLSKGEKSERDTQCSHKGGILAKFPD